MKKTAFIWTRFVPVLLLTSSLSGITLAQKAKSTAPKAAENEMNVRVIERNGNEVREIERTYRIDGLSDLERDKLVMKLVDSLKTARKGSGKRQMTIIVDDNHGDRIVTRERNARVPGDALARRNWQPKTNTGPFGDNRTWRYELRRGADSLALNLDRLQFQFKDMDRQFVRPFEDWNRNMNSKPSSIRGLDAYPNNPDHNQLNLRFTAPAKGDVNILVTNTKGKEVARRELKDFSGEFIGQIDLGKSSQGTYFITVTQNEDGAVKRIVID
jgi:hypothetical protein